MNNKIIKGKYDLLKCILISFQDFLRASWNASYIIDNKIHKLKPVDNSYLLLSLYESMVISYSRPFLNNKGITNLPNSFTRELNKEERKLHNDIITTRNKVVAHSDDEIIKMKPHFSYLNGVKILIPLSSSFGAYKLEPTKKFLKLAQKQSDRCSQYREELENDLRDIMPVDHIPE